MLKNIYKNEGVPGLFKGNGVNVCRIMLQTSIEFYTYEYAKAQMFGLDLNQNSKYLLSGAIGGLIGCTCAYPLDLVKTLFSYQVTDAQFKGIFNSLSKIVKQQGFLALYKGLSATLIGIVPYASLKLTFYQLLKNWFYTSGGKERKMSSTANLAFGGLSGCMAVTITYPTDLMRRRIQILLFGETKSKVSYRMIASEIWRKDGFRGFYAGLIATYCKVIPAVSLTFMLNDKLKSLMRVE